MLGKSSQEVMLALTRQDARNKEIEVWERDPLQNPCTLIKNRFPSTVLRPRQEASALRSDAARPGSSFLEQIPDQVRDDPEQRHFRAGSVGGQLTVIPKTPNSVIPTKLLVGISILLLHGSPRRTDNRPTANQFLCSFQPLTTDLYPRSSLRSPDPGLSSR